MEVVLARSLAMVVLTYPLLKARRIPLWGVERRLLLARGALGFMALSGFYYGIIHLPLADVTVIHYTNPVFTAVFAALVLREVLRPREVVLTLTSLAGVVIVARPAFLFGTRTEPLDPVAVGAALAAALLSAAAYVTVRRLGRTNHPLVIVFYFGLISTAGSAPFVWGAYVHPVGVEWVHLVGVGLTTQIAQVSITLGLRAERAGRAMAVGYLQVVFAAALGVLFFGEVPDRWTLFGAATILGSTAALTRSPERSLAKRPAPPTSS